jgi:hypothetical protein
MVKAPCRFVNLLTSKGSCKVSNQVPDKNILTASSFLACTVTKANVRPKKMPDFRIPSPCRCAAARDKQPTTRASAFEKWARAENVKAQRFEFSLLVRGANPDPLVQIRKAISPVTRADPPDVEAEDREVVDIIVPVANMIA